MLQCRASDSQDEESSRRPYSTLWKEAFSVSTEWDQYDHVYEIAWDFTNLEREFSPGSRLHNQRVYLFGCTEPQLLHFAHHSRVIHIPAVVTVTSPFPPSDNIGIKSVQREEELIVPMKAMKMDWIPFLPPPPSRFRVRSGRGTREEDAAPNLHSQVRAATRGFGATAPGAHQEVRVLSPVPGLASQGRRRPNRR